MQNAIGHDRALVSVFGAVRRRRQWCWRRRRSAAPPERASERLSQSVSRTGTVLGARSLDSRALLSLTLSAANGANNNSLQLGAIHSYVIRRARHLRYSAKKKCPGGQIPFDLTRWRPTWRCPPAALTSRPSAWTPAAACPCRTFCSRSTRPSARSTPGRCALSVSNASKMRSTNMESVWWWSSRSTSFCTKTDRCTCAPSCPAGQQPATKLVSY